MKYFHHKSIKNYTIALLDLFDDIHVIRQLDDNSIFDIKVPIQFGSKEKAFYLTNIETQNLLSGNVNILPKMVLSFDSLSKATNRNTNKLAKLNISNTSFQYNSVAYDFNYTLFIATRTFTDATVIIEQIAPLFRPDYPLKINEIFSQKEPTTIPVSLGEFSINLPSELADDEIRIIEVEVPLTIKGNLYLPFKDSKLIENLNVQYNIDFSEKEQKYLLDCCDNLSKHPFENSI